MKGIRIRSVAKSRSVFELLGNPIRWIRGAYYGVRTKSAVELQPESLSVAGFNHRMAVTPQVNCFCLVGAIRAIYHTVGERSDAIRRVAQAIQQTGTADAEIDVANTALPTLQNWVIDWNDSAKRTWSDVRNVARAAHI